MASSHSTSRQSRQRGSALYGALAGLLIGLILAAAVAFYVTKAPIPFVDRASRQNGPSSNSQTNSAQVSDPNAGLSNANPSDATNATALPAPTPLTPQSPGNTETPPPPDDLGALIATLPLVNGKPPVATDAPANKPGNALPNPVVAVAPKSSTPTAIPAGNVTDRYYLQAGAFRGATEAESLKARILLLGLPVAVQKADVDGKSINRVRVGPFARLDDMNRARSRLGENKIEAAVVRQ